MHNLAGLKKKMCKETKKTINFDSYYYIETIN